LSNLTEKGGARVREDAIAKLKNKTRTVGETNIVTALNSEDLKLN